MGPLLVLSTSLVVLAWIFTKQAINDGPPLLNYEGTQYYNPDKVYTPTSLREIQSIVVKAQKNGETIRPLGSGHNWQEFGYSLDISYLSLRNYRGLVKLDKLGRTASFKGGTYLWEINTILAEHDLALSILPSISNQTIGGAVATGTHGSGVNFGHLSTFTTSIEFINGLGEVVNVSNETDPGLFQAVGVSVGMLGIITQVTMKVEPIFNLLEVEDSVTLSECLDNMKTIRTSHEHVQMWIELVSGICKVLRADRTKQPANSHEVYPFKTKNMEMLVLEMFQWFLSLVPCLTDTFFGTFVSPDKPLQRVGVSWEVFNIPHYIPSNHREGEVAVPWEKCDTVMKDIIELKRRFNIYINHIIAVRFVKRDSFWLSNSYDTDVCHITLYLYNPSDYQWNFYIESVYNATRSYGGRPHWGKSFRMDSKDLREIYPKFDVFMEYRRKLDPYEVFVSTDMKEIFGV